MLAAATLFWAGNFVVARALRDELPPVSLNVWRWLIALAVLAPFAAPGLWRHRALLLARWRLFTLLGATGIAGFHTLVYLALAQTSVMNAVVIASTAPVAIVGLSFLTRGDPFGRRQAVGIAVSLAGALVVVVRGDPTALAALRLDGGTLWMLLAVPLWAGYSVLLRRVPAQLPQVVSLSASTIAGLALLAPVYAVQVALGERLALTPATLAGLLYIASFAAVAAFLLWNRGVGLIGPNRAGSFLHLMPVFGALLSFAFLGERPEGFHLAGAALVVAGLGLALGTPRRRAADGASR
jgi:drug/metabolite transporter (DMT)-like permease